MAVLEALKAFEHTKHKQETHSQKFIGNASSEDLVTYDTSPKPSSSNHLPITTTSSNPSISTPSNHLPSTEVKKDESIEINKIYENVTKITLESPKKEVIKKEDNTFESKSKSDNSKDDTKVSAATLRQERPKKMSTDQFINELSMLCCFTISLYIFEIIRN